MTFFFRDIVLFFRVVESCFFFGGGGILQADNTFFEWLSLCQFKGLRFFFDCLKCFRRVAIFSGEGCIEIYQEG